jgi:hypothetical protein
VDGVNFFPSLLLVLLCEVVVKARKKSKTRDRYILYYDAVKGEWS